MLLTVQAVVLLTVQAVLSEEFDELLLRIHRFEDIDYLRLLPSWLVKECWDGAVHDEEAPRRYFNLVMQGHGGSFAEDTLGAGATPITNSGTGWACRH